MQQGDRGGDLLLAIERVPGPVAGEVAPPGQLPRRVAKTIDRTIVAAERRATQRTPDACRRIGELLLQPAPERVVEQPRRRRLGQDLEERVDAGLHRPLAEQLGAESMDGADVRFFQPGQRGIEQTAGGPAGDRGPLTIETFAQSQLQLARGFFREGHGDDLVDRGASFREDANDAAHELGRLAGTGSGLDDQRLVERGRRSGAARGRQLSGARAWRAELDDESSERRRSRHPSQRR